MRAHIIAGLALALAAGLACAANDVPPATAGMTEVERCGVGVLANGEMAQVPLPTLHVLGIGADSKVTLPAETPPAVLAVICGRRSRLPVGFDEKVVIAGYPFYIVGQDGATTVLEAVKGKLTARAEDGNFTAAESATINGWLVTAQARIDKHK